MATTNTTATLYGGMYNCTYTTAASNFVSWGAAPQGYTASDLETARSEGRKACEMKIKAAREEMDNLLEDYLEDLRSMEDEELSPSEVVKRLHGIQKAIESLMTEPASEDALIG